MIHNVVAFTVYFRGGPLDNLKAAWAEIYDGSEFLPRPTVVYATEHNDEVIECSRRRLPESTRYEVDAGGRDHFLECRHAP